MTPDSQHSASPSAHVDGFEPVARADARVLVLGTVPSALSLQKSEYYGNPRNAFWRVMAHLLGRDEDEEYAARTDMLLEAGIALWDVLRTAERPGSLDASIVAASARPNDFAGFFEEHPAVRAVFFNGGTARRLWDRLVASDGLPGGSSLTTLPSTSPANAALTLEGKIAAWRQVVEIARRPPA